MNSLLDTNKFYHFDLEVAIAKLREYSELRQTQFWSKLAHEYHDLQNYPLIKQLKEKVFTPPINDENYKILRMISRYARTPGSRVDNKADLALKLNNFDLLKWLSQRDIYPTLTGINYNLVHIELDILEWCLQHDILPSSLVISYVSGQIPKLNLLAQYDCFPDNFIIDRLISAGDLDTLKWLKEVNHEISFTFLTADWAAIKEQWEILDWLYQMDIKPSFRPIEYAVINDKPDILDVLYSYGIEPVPHQINLSIKGSPRIQDWMNQHGYYSEPSQKNKLVVNTVIASVFIAAILVAVAAPP